MVLFSEKYSIEMLYSFHGQVNQVVAYLFRGCYQFNSHSYLSQTDAMVMKEVRVSQGDAEIWAKGFFSQ